MHDLDLTDINVMNRLIFYLQPNDYIYIKPQTKNWELKMGELRLLLLHTTTFSCYLKN
jgi:hypothetical protein